MPKFEKLWQSHVFGYFWVFGTLLMRCRSRSGTEAVKKELCNSSLWIKKEVFFPSCASVALARSSHIVVLVNELFRCIFYVPLWKVESGVRTITQSEVLSGPKDQRHKSKTKQQKQNPQTQPNKKQNPQAQRRKL